MPLPEFADRLGKADGSDDISMFFYTLIRVAESARGRIRKTAPETVAFGSPSGHRHQQICKAAIRQERSSVVLFFKLRLRIRKRSLDQHSSRFR